MKNTFSKIAAIIKFSDDDIRLIQDEFIKFHKKYMHGLTSKYAMSELVNFSNNSSSVSDFDIKIILQILANIEAKSNDIKEMNYVDGNILFTISFEDEHDESIRYCINDVKCFRNHFDMHLFFNEEATRIQWESLCSRILANKTLDTDSNI